MRSADEYRELAKECLREAEQTSEIERKKTLLNVAKLFKDTALKIERGVSAKGTAA